MNRKITGFWAPGIRNSNSGSILIYVLWILVVISVLAFQLASASRVVSINRSAFANQLKKQMQIESAVQFAMFKIMSDQWENSAFKLNLNNQEIKIEILNESGFVSIYETSDRTLKRIFEFIGLDDATVGEIESTVAKKKKAQKFNSFLELRQFSGIDDEVIQQLIPLVSIFRQQPVNPLHSPAEVLKMVYRIDQYGVQQLIESTDEIEKIQLRKELARSLMSQGMKLSKDLSPYYRVNISLNGYLHRAFVKYSRQQNKYKVVMINSSKEIIDANAS